MYGERDITVGPALNYSVLFSRVLPNHRREQVTDKTMPATGRYSVRLVPGYTYIAAVNYGSYHVETQEYFVANDGPFPIVKDFYLSFTDTTDVDHSHCLIGRKAYR